MANGNILGGPAIHSPTAWAFPDRQRPPAEEHVDRPSILDGKVELEELGVDPRTNPLEDPTLNYGLNALSPNQVTPKIADTGEVQ